MSVKLKLFANPKKITRITIPEIEVEEGVELWIEVRDEMAIGQQRDVFAGSVRGFTTTPDGQTRTDYDGVGVSFGTVFAYLVDWNARDEHGKHVELTPEAIRQSEIDAYPFIEKAVNAHIEKVRAAKKHQEKPSSVVPISPSAA